MNRCARLDYLVHQLSRLDRTGQPHRERVLLYPEAQHETVPELLAFTLAGGRLGELVSQHWLPVPTSGVGDTGTWLPSRELFERMVVEIGGCP
ncbi:hypothetical protein [Saccharothrix australiensis]|uniref:hypothetical protein n=1 Tax=Saccharothrix australiensis TaxID=2072 RepID=UPI000EB10AB2|nr:hypothetical protein [Saccharothrix australiensis]